MQIIQKCCPECGSKLILKELKNEGMVPFCTQCNDYRFPMFNIAVSMIVINKENGKILLIKQYGKDRYILVAGYVNRGEKVEDTVKREVKEETGMTVVEQKFNRTCFFEKSNTLMCNFTVYVENDKELNPNDEIDSLSWFTPAEAQANIANPSLAADFLNAYIEEE